MISKKQKTMTTSTIHMKYLSVYKLGRVDASQLIFMAQAGAESWL
jgi:hypothetical protein